VHEVSEKKSERIFNQHIEQSGGVNFGQGNEIDIAGSVVAGDQINAQESQGFINRPSGPVEQHFGPSKKIDTGGGAHIGGNVNIDKGDFVGRDKTVHGDEVRGDKFTGDKFTGDKVAGDKVAGDSISVGDMTGNTGVAIGRGAQSSVTTTTTGLTGADLNLLFAPLLAAVQQAAPPEKQSEAMQAAHALQAEAVKGKQADDSRLAKLIDGLANLVPGAVSAIVSAFASPVLAGIAGPVSKYVLERIKGA
jgi:hypothetical protein